MGDFVFNAELDVDKRHCGVAVLILKVCED